MRTSLLLLYQDNLLNSPPIPVSVSLSLTVANVKRIPMNVNPAMTIDARPYEVQDSDYKIEAMRKIGKLTGLLYTDNRLS